MKDNYGYKAKIPRLKIKISSSPVQRKQHRKWVRRGSVVGAQRQDKDHTYS